VGKASVIAIFCAAILFSLGLVMVFNTTAAEALDRNLPLESHYALVKQLIFAAIGLLGALLSWWLGYHNIIRLSPYFLVFTILFLIAVFIPSIGQEFNGAKRWISIAGYTFQPSEIAKYTMPIYFIMRFIERKAPLEFWDLIKLLIPLSIPLGLIFLEPDNGTTFIITCSFIMLFVMMGVRLKYWAIPLIVLLLVGGVVAWNMPHVSDRITIYLHPEKDLLGKGHQPHQAKIAAGSGQLFGRGLGESLQKFNYLPEARSDYIAAIYAEEFGFIGMLFLMALYLSLAIAGFMVAAKANDLEGFYLASLITFLITFQAFLNLGVVSGLLPSKGTTLPFFSLGGSSLLINITALCILINIETKARKIARNEISKNYRYQLRRDKRASAAR